MDRRISVHIITAKFLLVTFQNEYYRQIWIPEDEMKNCLHILAILLVFAMSGVYTYADVGVPESPKYTVVIGIYGAPYYSDWDSCSEGTAEGTLTGGLPFYVWTDFGDGVLAGTTNAKASGAQYDSFVYISSDSTLGVNTTIDPDVGERTPETVMASTTDELNLRSGPGTGFKVIKVLSKGTEVNYDYTFRTDTTWMYVNAGGYHGWVSGDYLRTINIKLESGAEDKANDYGDSGSNISDGGSTGELIENGGNRVPDTANDEAHRKIVAGVILICLGFAVLIAVLAIYILRNRRN